MPRAPRKDELKEAVGLRLRVAREALGLQAKEMCQALNVAQNRWSQWESGTNLLDPVVAIQIADRYGITMEYLYRGDVSTLRFALASKLQTRAS